MLYVSTEVSCRCLPKLLERGYHIVVVVAEVRTASAATSAAEILRARVLPEEDWAPATVALLMRWMRSRAVAIVR